MFNFKPKKKRKFIQTAFSACFVNDINWSKRILGKEALTQININIIIELFNPKLKPYHNPSKIELLKIFSILLLLVHIFI